MRPILAGIQTSKTRRHRQAICLRDKNESNITQPDQKCIKNDEKAQEIKKAMKLMVKNTVVKTYLKAYEAEKSSFQNQIALSNIISQVCNELTLPTKYIMPSPVIVSFSDLAILTISFAGISSFKKGTFITLANLESLDVSHNNISDFEVKRSLTELTYPLKYLTYGGQNPSQLKLQFRVESKSLPPFELTNSQTIPNGFDLQSLNLAEFSQQLYSDIKYSRHLEHCIDKPSAKPAPHLTAFESQVQLQPTILSRNVPRHSKLQASDDRCTITPDPYILRQLQAMSRNRVPKGSRRQSIFFKVDRLPTPLV
jgi:hypothetical protein